MADRAELQHRGGKAEHNFTMIQYFEWYLPADGKHWNKFKDESARLASMGITSAWLPPCYKGSGENDVGYGTYDLYDLGEFDQKGTTRTKYGTKEELVDAMSVAKKAGIITYIDAVLNHKMGADEKETFLATAVDSNDRTKDVSDKHNITAWSKFTFPGRGDKYSPMKWSFNHFSGCDYDAATDTKAIFRIQGDGKYWASGVNKENANYDYLMGMDLDVSHPEVREDLFRWGEWILKETGASGFRFDAVKHIDVAFIRDFVNHVRATSNSANIFCCGEYWEDSLETTGKYLDDIGVQFTVFDAPLHYNFKEAGEAKANFDLRQIWDRSIVQKRPLDAVLCVDNHDSQIGQSLESWVNPAFKPLAYAMILLRVEGYPCVFYGDLYGCGGDNPQKPVTQLEDLIRARKLYSYGETPNCVGWVRTGAEGHPDGCAVVLCNGSEGVKRMEVGKEHAGEVWTDVLGWHTGEVTIGEDGWAEFRCPAESVSIWVKKDAQGRDEFSKAN
ncbi:hypothetical protein QFC20_001465 [Naganishia adeliensis]|uniref:Uncharacterized protein n=1 Tax=Naganishia adeliensis TaxID=92952 RepID=A0ACC2WT43_9TREE|nr:hypothetical protein QFC20_001465 [Naganishia adeliensis]